MQIQAPDQRVILRGLLVDSYFPSEGLLQVRLDVSAITAANTYMIFKEKLEDILRGIDKAHSKKARGRTLKANYLSVQLEGHPKPDRIRVLFFAPIPSITINKLKKLRAKWYEILDQKTIVIERTEQRILRLLPVENAKGLAEEKKIMNEKILAVAQEAADFTHSEEYQEIMKHLADYGFRDVKSPLKKNGETIHPVMVQLFPLNFEQGVYEQILDKTVVKELADTEKKIRERVSLQFEEKLRNIIGQLAILLKAKHPKPEDIKARTEEMRKMMEGSMNFAASSVMNSMVSAIDTVTESITPTGVKDEEKIRKAVLDLATSVKVPDETLVKTSTPSEALTVIVTTLDKTISSRAQALMWELS